jgi:hypothetical protein
MRRLSPDSLFHFTPRFDDLLGILKNTFYPRYCYEEFGLTGSARDRYTGDAFPMVCFCDISLSQLVNHIETYGKYGLGMAKEWGIKNGLNPVIYYGKDSHMAKAIYELAGSIKGGTPKTLESFVEVLMYLKPYEGTLYRGGRVKRDDVRFYDEHEWRYVPDIGAMKNKGLQLTMGKEAYLEAGKLRDANKKLETNETRLSFGADDVKYVIIREEREINRMIRELRVIKGSKYDLDTIERLMSRIITVKQIERDF